MLKKLLAWPCWQQQHIRLFGKRVVQPRLSAFVGDSGLRYRYSGLQLEAAGWPEWLLPVRTAVCEATDTSFNSCLLNYYRNGEDHMGWHADDEPELGEAPALAIVSLGASRRLHLRRKGEHRACCHFDLPHNSLLFMPPGMQTTFQHRLAPSRRVNQPRISLTFRRILPGDGP